MAFASFLARDHSLEKALDSDCTGIELQLRGASPDLLLAFVSPHHIENCESLPLQLRKRLCPRVLLGCSGETIVGGREELEDAPALSLWAAALPQTTLQEFHVEFRRTPDGIASSGFPEPGDDARDVRAVLFLGEPFTTPPDSVIDRMAEDYPGAPVIGGMASGSRHPGSNRLFHQDATIRKGGVGVVLKGGSSIRAIVSQGCRPIGKPAVITRSEENVVMGLGGVPPLRKLAELFPTLSPRDQELARNGLHLGLAMDEYRASFGLGDFLISNVIGADGDHGSIAVGNMVRTGQTAQFHIRDAESADADLNDLLRRDAERQERPPQAALLFSCNGRGTNLFPAPHHDAAAIQDRFGPLPLAGFFAQGEFGPVGGKNFIHGFTASIALFE